MEAAQHHTSRQENLTLLLGGIGFVLGGGIALFALPAHAPIFGRGSVGELAAIIAFFSSAAAFLIGLRFSGLRSSREWLGQLSRLRWGVNQFGLAVVHAAFSFYLTTAVFAVFSGAFRHLQLDRYAGAFSVALACAVCVYATASSATSLSTGSLAVLVALFLVTGSLASALNASDAEWWQQHFSALGAASDRSGIVFNFTLIVTGLVLTALADFLTQDLETWARHHKEPLWKVAFVRGSLMALGALLGMVGVIPVNRSLLWHNLVTYGAIAVFAVLLVAIPILFRRLPGGFVFVTGLVVALIAAVVWLHLGVGYLNITAFEMGAVSTVFIWLVLFIRTVVAAANDLPNPPPTPAPATPTETAAP